jgi:uncharacterized protein YfaS (alpha-2-macroglobulin family)
MQSICSCKAGNRGFEVNDYLFSLADNQQTVVNKPVSFLIGSSAESIFMIKETQHKPKLKQEEIESRFSFYKIDKEVKEIPVTPGLEDIGGMTVNFAFVKDNRVYTYHENLQVQEDVKQLKVEVLTFRNKIEPGSEEKWTVKISGQGNEAVAAEVLTSMYDASLNQFKPHSWHILKEFKELFFGAGWTANRGFRFTNSDHTYVPVASKYYLKEYPEIDTYLKRANNAYRNSLDNARGLINQNMPEYETGEASALAAPTAATPTSNFRQDMSSVMMLEEGNTPKHMKLPRQQHSELLSEVVVTVKGKTDERVGSRLEIDANNRDKQDDQPGAKIRTNFNETAFFFPQLTTDKDSSLSFTFTLPDALTMWKWQIFAHDKEANFGLNEKTIISQKTLMAQANAPRFMREGDKIEFSAKVSNLSDKELKGNATLLLFDAATMQPLDKELNNTSSKQSFTAVAGQSTAVKFSVAIPSLFNKAITWRIVAKAGGFADGEENTSPVLSNRMLVTESLPLYVRNTASKKFEFTKLKNQQSNTLRHQSLTVEYTSNPVWYALQSLPYLIEFPYECSEQIFNRFFANALGSKIINSNPRIQQVFDEWKKDTSALKSNLQKNEELKSILIQETPWLLQAESEEQQKKNLALLLDAATIEKSSKAMINKLAQMQTGSGGFPWFEGGREDRYITQYIITGIGRLQNMEAVPFNQQDELRKIATRAIEYLDEEIANDYKRLLRNKRTLKTNNTNPIQLQYLYMRSIFKGFKPAKDREAYDYFYEQSKKYWIDQNTYFKAMTASFLLRTGESKFATQNILPALFENAVIDEDAGMYWKGNDYGYYWYHAPVEQQALMIELVNEVYKTNRKDNLQQKINDMKTWLLRQKQTNNWRTTKATADACYALLINGSSWIASDRTAEVKLGNLVIDGNKREAGTGYFKTKIEGSKVIPEMANISVSMTESPGSSTTSPSWGAVYWQYFENLDKITTAATPISIQKKLFIEKNTDRGIVLEAVNDGDELKVGNKVKIRVEIKADRDMEYVHLKDMRAASMEPVNVLSSYKYQDGLSYYESTKDASTNFFISHLARGTYVFEYPVTITHEGDFSVGIASAQCMYAPEFNTHSEGIRVKVKTRL